MINRKIVASTMSILTVLALTGGATFAAFTSSADSTNNTFSTGTVNLTLTDTDETTPAQTVTTSLAGSNLVPGGTPSSAGFIQVNNPVGGSTLGTVTLGGTQTVTSSPNIADKLNLTLVLGDDNTCTTNPNDITASVNTALGGGTNLTVADLNSGSATILTNLAAGSSKFLCVSVALDASAGNTYQNKTITETFSFVGTQ